MSSQDLKCDVLVIGSGPGGALTAMILAQAGRDVLCVEEGARGRDDLKRYSLEEMDAFYRYGGLSVAWGDPKVTYLEGRCLGGASEINGSLYNRPAPEILENWAKDFQINDFGSQQLEKLFEINEELLQVSFMPGGVGVGSRLMQRGASRLGWKTTEMPRMWQSLPGPDGQHMSMRHSFIPNAVRSGCRVLTDTKIERLYFRGKEAVYASAIRRNINGQQESFKISFKDVFICGGAIQTPFLLRKSGITKNIGNSLCLHPAIRVVARFEEKASDEREGIPVIQVTEFKPQMVLGGSFSGKPHLALWLVGRDGFDQCMERPECLGIYYALISAKGKGQVRALPMVKDALVKISLLDEDLRDLGEGIYKLGQLMFAAGAKTIYSPINEDNEFLNLTQMEKFRKGLPRQGVDYSTVHLFSSCPMGEDLRCCAADSYGRLHGYDNVYLNDSSILPTSPAANPQAVIMAIARRNAQHYLKENQK